MTDDFGFIERWTTLTANVFILTTKGDPHGDPPDVGAYLLYAFKEKSLTEILKKSTREELKALHHLFCTKKEDENFLRKVSSQMQELFNFCASKIADKLTKITNEQWTPFEIKEEELASLP